MVDPKRLKVHCILKGKDGYTPVRGIDYLNEDDRTEILDTILASLPAAEVDMFDGNIMFALNDDASDEEVNIEIDDMVYGIENATINETPVKDVYDFTVL